MLMTAWPPYRSVYSTPSLSQSLVSRPLTGSMSQSLYTSNKFIVNILEGAGLEIQSELLVEPEHQVHILNCLS